MIPPEDSVGEKLKERKYIRKKKEDLQSIIYHGQPAFRDLRTF